VLDLKGKVFVIIRPQRKEFQTNLEPDGPWGIVVIIFLSYPVSWKFVIEVNKSI
jgi:hypothetical protein